MTFSPFDLVFGSLDFALFDECVLEDMFNGSCFFFRSSYRYPFTPPYMSFSSAPSSTISKF